MSDLAWGTIAYCSYYILCESLWGKTIAKIITKTKVVSYQGEKPSFFLIVWRTLCRLIPFDPISFAEKIGCHDSLSATIVVNDVKKSTY